MPQNNIDALWAGITALHAHDPEAATDAMMALGNLTNEVRLLEAAITAGAADYLADALDDLEERIDQYDENEQKQIEENVEVIRKWANSAVPCVRPTTLKLWSVYMSHEDDAEWDTTVLGWAKTPEQVATHWINDLDLEAAHFTLENYRELPFGDLIPPASDVGVKRVFSS